MPLRIRTTADNRQLREGEKQFESVRGAISARIGNRMLVPEDPNVVTISTTRGIYRRKLQLAVLDKEALGEFIVYLKELHDSLDTEFDPGE